MINIRTPVRFRKEAAGEGTHPLKTMHHDHQDALEGPHFDAAMVSACGRLLRLHKGGGAPKPPPVNKKLEQMQLKLLQAQLRQAGKKIEMPRIETPAAPPPPPPPPTTSSIDAEEAATDARRQALKRTGYQATLFAGETGGSRGRTLGGGGSLLG